MCFIFMQTCDIFYATIVRRVARHPMIPQSSVLEAIRLSNLKDKIAAKKQVSRAKRNVFRSPLHMPQVSVISQDPNVEKDKQIIKNPSCLGECIPEATSLSLNMDQKNVDTEVRKLYA